MRDEDQIEVIKDIPLQRIILSSSKAYHCHYNKIFKMLLGVIYLIAMLLLSMLKLSSGNFPE